MVTPLPSTVDSVEASDWDSVATEWDMAVSAWAVMAWAVLAWAVLAWAVLAWAVLARASAVSMERVSRLLRMSSFRCMFAHIAS